MGVFGDRVVGNYYFGKCLNSNRYMDCLGFIVIIFYVYSEMVVVVVVWMVLDI